MGSLAMRASARMPAGRACPPSLCAPLVGYPTSNQTSGVACPRILRCTRCRKTRMRACSRSSISVMREAACSTLARCHSLISRQVSRWRRRPPDHAMTVSTCPGALPARGVQELDQAARRRGPWLSIAPHDSIAAMLASSVSMITAPVSGARACGVWYLSRPRAARASRCTGSSRGLRASHRSSDESSAPLRGAPTPPAVAVTPGSPQARPRPERPP